jgi:hypothetical protein
MQLFQVVIRHKIKSKAKNGRIFIDRRLQAR